MRYGDSLSSVSLASAYSGGISLFSLAHGRSRSRPGQPAHSAAQFVDVSEVTQFS